MRTATRKTRPSLGDLAEQFEAAVSEKRSLETRLTQAAGEFDGERSRLHSEIAVLREQLEQLQKPKQSETAEGTQESISSAKERLIRDEMERKFQALIIETRRERNRFAEQVAKMKTKLSKCICQSSGLE
jgi:DNA repair exonuclease SbcCD ATPase subunit